MDGATEHRLGNWVASLRGFLGERQAARERCELCNAEIDGGHPHLIEPEKRRLLCVCPPCAMLFSNRTAARYRRVPDAVIRLSDFTLSDADWDALLIPIDMAFFFHSSPESRVLAMFPGPAGATESTLNLNTWDNLAEANPILKELEEDVEALLVNRVGGAREYYRVPMDRCFELTGLIRSHWHGLSGGEGVRRVIQTFFEKLRQETSGRGITGHA